MDTAELLRRVRQIEIKTRRLSEHLFMGGYHSAFKGRGMTFSEVRPYQWGDEVRNIEWNVSARTGHTHIKVYEEERELTLMLVVDISRSVFFGAAGEIDKRDFIAEICAVLAFSASSNADNVGLLLYSDQPEVFVPPGQGRQHVLRIIREVLHAEPNGKGTDLSGAFLMAQNVLKKRSICFLLSDFQQKKPYEKALKIIARKHDCIGIQCWDHREQVMPDVGLTLMTDPETEALTWADTGLAKVRAAYEKQFAEHLAHTSTLFRRSGVDLIHLRTDQPYAQKLLQFFENRN